MDTRWKSSAELIGWLVLFTFGLSGVRPMVFGGYSLNSTVTMNVYMVCGVGALIICLYAMRTVPVMEMLTFASWRKLYSQIPVEVRAFVALISIIWTFAKLNRTIIDVQFNAGFYAVSLLTATALVTMSMMQLILLVDALRDPPSRTRLWRNSLVYRCARAWQAAPVSRSAGTRIMLTFAVFFASGFGFLVVLRYPQAIVMYAPLFVIVTLPTLVMQFRRASYLNRIVKCTSGLVEGVTHPDLRVRGGSELATLAGNINRLKHGVEVSQAAQVKSERLKTDLITNVSHDLRTPLTSVITYTELLKTPDLDEDTRAEYLNVIDRKAKRLKVLIDDLFEASKMASGNTELVKDRVDMAQLLAQALAERDEDIQASGLDFRVSKPEDPVYCVVDGQRMWRVFDNLVGNILKYSLDGTRVYIAVESSADKTKLTFKNIANYELNGDTDELFERFKRADESRHTEGSGLGLAIAKSIVDLHGGQFLLETDGDLFKATVVVPNQPEGSLLGQ